MHLGKVPTRFGFVVQIESLSNPPFVPGVASPAPTPVRDSKQNEQL
jgi:hypothetical protein